MTTRTKLCAVLFSCLTVTLITGIFISDHSWAKEKTKSVKIGCPADFTGPYATYGTKHMNAIKLATKEVNEAGGFKVGETTYTLDPIMEDIRGDASRAAAVTTGMIKDHNVKFLMGGVSTPCATIAQIARVQRRIYFTAASAVLGHLGEQGYDLIFPVLGDPEIKNAKSADSVKALLPFVKTVAWCLPDDETSSQFLKAFGERAEQIGLTKLENVRFPWGSTDFTPFITRAKALKPDVLGIGWIDAIGGPMGRQAMELDAAPIFIGWSCRYEPIREALGGDLDRPYIYFQPGVDLNNPWTDGQKELVARYLAFTGETEPPPNLYAAAWGYDFLHMLVEAMKKAGTVDDVDAVAAALRSIKYDGLAHPIDFDDKTNKVDLPTAGILYIAGKMVARFDHTPGLPDKVYRIPPK